MKATIGIDARMVSSSGNGTVLQNVASRLIARRQDWQFQLFGAPDVLADYPWAKAPNVSVTAFDTPIYSLREMWTWPFKAASACDLVWIPHYTIPLLWRGRVLASVHDVAHLALPDLHKGLLKQVYAKVMFQAVRRRALGIMLLSIFSQQQFEHYVGQPRGKTAIAPGAVDEAWFAVKKGAPLHERPYILFVGNVKPHKNLRRLLQAFDRIREAIPHDLVIVGKREGFITGDDSVADMVTAMDGRAVFTGYVEDDTLKRYYAQADALVLPSLYEGFGLPPLEAMATGCPTLVSRAASLPEACGDAALYCDPLDVEDIARQLKRLVTDKVLADDLRQRGLAWSKDFTWDKPTAVYEAMMQTILDERR